jgi:hypothetical protein
MSRIPLALPPGIYRNGTDKQSAGRYYDADLVRWYGSAIGPILGWRSRSTTTVTGKARACLPWKDNSANTWFAIATESHLYVCNRLGTVFDITPSGFTSGHADASGSGGYGSSTFGTGTYGTPRPGSSLITDATQCSLDNFGQNLFFMSPDDGHLYKWALNTAVIAAVVAGAPTGKAIVCTAEGFIFVLGTSDPRTLSWCDQRDATVWTPSATNQAGDYTLQTAGRLMCGRNVQGQTLILTDVDAWTATYAANNDVYDFKRRGDACGAISRQCLVPFNLQAAWMSPSGFWQYNGFVQPIECDVLDYIQRDINLLQISKIFGVHNAANSEITWYYCSASSIEINRSVVWNYKGNYWNIGRPNRLCGADKTAGFQYPIMVDSTGTIYDHEVGYAYGSDTPYAETGPITLGAGDRVMNIMGLYPDDVTVGDVTATFMGKNNPDDAYTSYGPYTLTSQTDVLFSARQLKVRFDGARFTDWRVGVPALEVTPGSGR